MENDQIKKILSALAQAKGPAPLGYISLHTGIKDPLQTLEKMERRGLVNQSPCPSWSSCMEPTFEIVLPAKEESANAVIARAK
jgi:hypothetical protein